MKIIDIIRKNVVGRNLTYYQYRYKRDSDTRMTIDPPKNVSNVVKSTYCKKTVKIKDVVFGELGHNHLYLVLENDITFGIGLDFEV